MSKKEPKIPLVGVSEFVKRQTADSTFTHYFGTWEELRRLTENSLKYGEPQPGYRDGVVLIDVCTDKFCTYTNYPMFEEMGLSAEWAKTPGREHEPAKLQVKILEPKIPCKFVDIVLYKKEVLEEDGDEATGATWDIVSINGRLNDKIPPMKALTIVRNWLHLPGGTKMKGKTAEDVLEMLCESILYKNGIKYQKEVKK